MRDTSNVGTTAESMREEVARALRADIVNLYAELRRTAHVLDMEGRRARGRRVDVLAMAEAACKVAAADMLAEMSETHLCLAPLYPDGPVDLAAERRALVAIRDRARIAHGHASILSRHALMGRLAEAISYVTQALFHLDDARRAGGLAP